MELSSPLFLLRSLFLSLILPFYAKFQEIKRKNYAATPVERLLSGNILHINRRSLDSFVGGLCPTALGDLA
jgi:hypothetical protein